MTDQTELDRLARDAGPDALQRLVELLWDPDAVTAASAAWRLASLTAADSVCSMLAALPLSPDRVGSSSFEWVWKPFDGASPHGCAHIVARVAELLATAPEESVPAEQAALDPRIVIPVCAVTLGAEIRGIRFHRLWQAEEDMTLVLAPYENEGWNGIIENGLADANASRRLRFLLGGVEMPQRVALALLVSEGRPADADDWLDLFQPPMLKPTLSRALAATLATGAGFAAILMYFGEAAWWLVSLPLVVTLAAVFAYRRSARYRLKATNPLEGFQCAFGGSPRHFELAAQVDSSTLLWGGCFSLVVAVWLASVAWPVGFYALLAASAWTYASRTRRKFLKPLQGIASSLTVTFAILSATLIGLNISAALGTVAVGSERIANSERLVLTLNRVLPPVLRPSLPLWLLTLSVLIALSVAAPQLRLVNRVFALRKRVGPALAVIAGLSSFTFFADRNLIQPRADSSLRRVAVVYRDAAEKELEKQIHALSLTAVSQAVSRMPRSTAQQYQKLFDTARPLERLNSETRDRYASEAAEALARSHASLAGIGSETAPAHGRPAVMVVASPGQAEEKLAAAAKAERTVTQAEAGLREAISSAFSTTRGAALDLAFDYFRDYSGLLEPALKMVVKPYAGRLIDQQAKGLVDRAAERVTAGATRVADRARNALRVLSRSGQPPEEGERLAAAMETGRADLVQATVAELKAPRETSLTGELAQPIHNGSSDSAEGLSRPRGSEQETKSVLLQLCK